MELPTIWQDWVLTLGQLVFFFALLPSVFSQEKPHPSTSLLTGSVLLVFAVTFSTLDLLWSAITSGLVAVTWLTLFGQYWHKQRRKKN